MFTLLFQDEHGGLQFLDRASGEFIDAEPVEGVLYMNIGDMFQRFSNGISAYPQAHRVRADTTPGFYPSALHRVIAKNPAAPRYSLPFFIGAVADAIIEPAPSRVAKDGKRMYEPVTFK